MSQHQTEPAEYVALRERCNLAVQEAIDHMLKELGAPLPMVVDRLVIAGAGLMAAVAGKEPAAAAMRITADRIEAGEFDPKAGASDLH